MGKKKKIIIGVVSALVLCLSFGGGYLLSGNGRIEELLEETGLSKKSTKDKGAKKGDTDMDDGIDAGAAGAGGDAGTGSKGAGADGTQKTNFVDDGGASVGGGTSPSESFSIKMSDLCTFSDPSGISFDTRYVLYGGSDCMPAKKVAAIGYNCKGVYVILYAKGGKAVGQYTCYVMSGESDAKGLASACASKNDSSAFSYGNWGDVAYEYCSGSYVQTSIDTYYKSGAITSPTPQAYLGMQFYFGGMSEYKPQSDSNGGGNTSTPGNSGNSSNPGNPSNPSNPGNPSNPSNPGNPSNPTNPDPEPDPNPNPNPNPDPEPGTSNENTIVVKSDQLTNQMKEAATPRTEAFDIAVTDKYTITDPSGIDYDTRYVLYGDASCAGVTSVPSKGDGVETKVECMYEVLYVKNGEAAAEYKYYLSKSEEGAQALQKVFQKTDCVKGRVFCLATENAQEIQDAISMLYQFSGGKLTDETPEAYLDYLVREEKYQFLKNINHQENPNPPTIELKGTTKEETFEVKMSDSFTYDESQVMPVPYDMRYVLYGDETCKYASQYKAAGFYEILYCKEESAMAEMQFYVMSDNISAEALAKELTSDSMMAQATYNVVMAMNFDLAGTIEGFIKDGSISEAAPKVYLNGIFVKEGMTEVTSSASISRTSDEILMSMLRIGERVGIERGQEDSILTEAMEKVGIETETEMEDSLLAETGEKAVTEIAAEPAEAEVFDPSEAGTITDPADVPEVPADTGEEETFDPSTAGNTEAVTEEPEVPAETFDPSAAGNAGTVTEEPEAPAEPQPGTKDIRITADYTYRDPEGLIYDERFVHYGGSDSTLAVQTAEETQTAVSGVYLIVYVKEGRVLTEYRCYIMNNQVICNETKPEDLEALMNSLPGMETPYEVSCAGYRSFMEQVYGLEDMENEGYENQR